MLDAVIDKAAPTLGSTPSALTVSRFRGITTLFVVSIITKVSIFVKFDCTFKESVPRALFFTPRKDLATTCV